MIVVGIAESIIRMCKHAPPASSLESPLTWRIPTGCKSPAGAPEKWLFRTVLESPMSDKEAEKPIGAKDMRGFFFLLLASFLTPYSKGTRRVAILAIFFSSSN